MGKSEVSRKRFYLKLGNKLAYIFCIQQIDKKNLHIYIKGQINQSYSTFVKRYANRLCTIDEIANLNFKWRDFKDVAPVQPIEYISFHPEKMAFSFQLKNGKRIETKHIDSDLLNGLIDYFILPDDISFYKESSIKNHAYIYDVKANSWLLFRGLYATNGNDLRNHPIFGNKLSKGDSSVQAVVGTTEFSIDGELSEIRKLRGSIFVGVFFRIDGLCEVEAYLFE
jgi:hypothetical protein